jgi:hypothetical protein
MLLVYSFDLELNAAAVVAHLQSGLAILLHLNAEVGK